MTPQEVAAYLQEHPDFFDQNAELLAHLTVPHPDSGEAISLTQRQMHALRTKIGQLEHKFAELIRFGEENDEIGEKVHRLSLDLLTTESFEDIRQVVMTHLLDDFSVPHVAMRIWNSVLNKDGAEFGPVSESVSFLAGDLPRPYCGVPHNDEILGWFGEAGARLRSVCLVPLLRDNTPFGLLAMGSEEAERFYPEMGTLYVSRIGELVAAAVLGELG
ncbi:MAG: DUF484 family protein [Rhodocyclaceae bacterium]|nr:DUF484 family protein [Rhodocyclaceae bacterium]